MSSGSGGGREMTGGGSGGRSSGAVAAALSGEAAGTASGILVTVGPHWWQQPGMAAVADESVGKGSVAGSLSGSGTGTTAAASAPGNALLTTAGTAPAACLQLLTPARPTWPTVAAGAPATGGSSSQRPSASGSGRLQRQLAPLRCRRRRCPSARPRRPRRSSSGNSWLRTGPPELALLRWMRLMAPGGLAGAAGSSSSSSST
jgi:hypothetical protein